MAGSVKYPNSLRTEIKRRGYTVQEVAQETDIPLRTLFDYCAGRVPIPWKRLQAIAHVIGCEPDVLVPLEQSTVVGMVDGNAGGLQEDSSKNGMEPLSAGEITQLFSLLGLGDNNVVKYDPSRRAALRQLLHVMGMATLLPREPEAWERLSSAMTAPTTMNAHVFNHFHKLVEGCWGLCNAGEMDMAEQLLSHVLPKMIYLAPYHSEAALVAAQGLRLRSILCAHQLKLADMVPLCQQAVIFARQSNDSNTLSAALNGLAVAFKYVNQLEVSFKTYQEALYYSDQASPLLRSRVHAGAAAAFAQRGRGQEALFYIGLAYENFPDHSEDDPNFLSADNGIFMLAYYEGLTYLALSQPKEAERAFESYKHHSANTTIPERNRLEIVNHLGRAAIMSNNLERYVQCLEEGLTGAIALQSKKRFDEALTIYQQNTPKEWKQEPRIRQIAERFQVRQQQD